MNVQSEKRWFWSLYSEAYDWQGQLDENLSSVGGLAAVLRVALVPSDVVAAVLCT